MLFIKVVGSNPWGRINHRYRYKYRAPGIILASIILVILGLSATRPSHAQINSCEADGWVLDVQRVDAEDLNAIHPFGLVFIREFKMFTLLESGEPSPISSRRPRFISFNTFNQLLSMRLIPKLEFDAINTAYDPAGRAIYVMDENHDFLHPYPIGRYARPFSHPRYAQPIDLRPLGLIEPVGIAFDPVHRALYILDPAVSAIIRIQADRRGSFAAPAALLEKRVEFIPLETDRIRGIRGLALHPTDFTLYTINPENEIIMVFDPAGRNIANCSLHSIFLRDPRGLTFAPSGDTTDDARNQSLFVADSGIGLDLILPGQIIELRISGP